MPALCHILPDCLRSPKGLVMLLPRPAPRAEGTVTPHPATLRRVQEALSLLDRMTPTNREVALLLIDFMASDRAIWGLDEYILPPTDGPTNAGEIMLWPGLPPPAYREAPDDDQLMYGTFSRE